MSERLLIVGGDAAGLSAAALVARLGAQKQICVFERGGAASYAACGMPYFLKGAIPDPASLLMRGIEEFHEAGVEVRLEHEVREIDTANQRATVVDKRTGAETIERFDQLLLATGARAALPQITNIKASNVFTLRHYDDAIAIDAYCQRRRPRHVTIIGGGYIGLELAEAFVGRDAAVTIAEATGRLFAPLDADLTHAIDDELDSHRVVVRTSEPVIALEGDAEVVSEVRTAQRAWECDLVIVGAGARPNVELAKSAQIALDSTGAIATDESMRTNVEGVWAAGDCTSAQHLVLGERVWIPLGPTANKQGRVAGASIAGRDVAFPGIVGTSLVKLFDLQVGITGIGEEQARNRGMDIAAITIDAPDVAPYYPGSRATTVKLTAEAQTGRLLGGQVLGRSGVSGRTNVIATALHARMTVDELAAVDLGYAPPFAPVWDPVLIAANQLRKRTS